jgi:RsiW-degrading membrane proteinase PrsW (M82 family)
MTASKTSACPSCGGPVLSDAKFCAACGTHLARTETLTPSAAVEAAAAPTPSARALPTITEMVAAAVPIVAIVVLGIVAPSVFTSPDAFFVYAFVQACVFLVVIRFFDLYEREPLSRIALMALWGATGAGFLALLGNGVISAILDEDLELAFGAAISASPVEEIAKGIALIAAFQLSRWANRRFGILESEGVTDGIVYGAAVGMGFALAEDIFYFFKFANESVATGLDVFLTRVASSAGRWLGHSLFTAAFGAGLGLATWSRGRLGRYCWPTLGLLVAMLLHAVWNGFDSLVLLSRYGWDTTVAFWGCVQGGEGYCARIPAGSEPGIIDTYETAARRDQGDLLRRPCRLRCCRRALASASAQHHQVRARRRGQRRTHNATRVGAYSPLLAPYALVLGATARGQAGAMASRAPDPQRAR